MDARFRVVPIISVKYSKMPISYDGILKRICVEGMFLQENKNNLYSATGQT